MKPERTTGILLVTLGALTVGMGVYFIVARPALLPEDVRFVGVTTSAPGSDMERWLRIVFRTWGVFMSGLGLVLGGIGASTLTGKQAWLRAGLSTGIAVAFGQFVVSNITLRSDFLWFVALLGVLALVTSACVVLRGEGPIGDRPTP